MTSPILHRLALVFLTTQENVTFCPEESKTPFSHVINTEHKPKTEQMNIKRRIWNKLNNESRIINTKQ